MVAITAPWWRQAMTGIGIVPRIRHASEARHFE
jgi:hypothetical protein